MFYSQFILAKKGPLGTIWIAAHLERKLKKNQVADTDIGVSVDSILFPEVPIALRLSSHLLLGVVRIYSRKVNYLFHDCSEALLKAKQAFRSTAVDLPPEESTAPYHSITLPETFDLDDFELPDSALLHGNFDDRHVSTREQITLQDTLDPTGYSTSQFGLDERFGDGDASQMGLDLDEELLLDNNLTLQDASVFDGAMHQVEGATDLTKMGIDEDHHGCHEGRNDEASKELSELLGSNMPKHVLPNVENVHRNDASSHRLIFNIQTPDLNEEFLPDDHTGGPSVVHDIDMGFDLTDPPSQKIDQSANFPSSLGVLEEAVEAHSEELLPASNLQNIPPDTAPETDKLDKPINLEVGCPDVTMGPTNAASANSRSTNLVHAVSSPTLVLGEPKHDSAVPITGDGQNHVESKDIQSTSSTLVSTEAAAKSVVPQFSRETVTASGLDLSLREADTSHTEILREEAGGQPVSMDYTLASGIDSTIGVPHEDTTKLSNLDQGRVEDANSCQTSNFPRKVDILHTGILREEAGGQPVSMDYTLVSGIASTIGVPHEDSTKLSNLDPGRVEDGNSCQTSNFPREADTLHTGLLREGRVEDANSCQTSNFPRQADTLHTGIRRVEAGGQPVSMNYSPVSGIASTIGVLHEDTTKPSNLDHGRVEDAKSCQTSNFPREADALHTGILCEEANGQPVSVDYSLLSEIASTIGVPHEDTTRFSNLYQGRVEDAKSCQTSNFSTLSSVFHLRPCTSESNQTSLISSCNMVQERALGEQSCNLQTPLVHREMHFSGSSGDPQGSHSVISTVTNLGLNQNSADVLLGLQSGVSNPLELPTYYNLKDVRSGHWNCFSSTEFSEPERMRFAVSGNVNMSNDLGQQTTEKGIIESDGSVDRIINLSGQKRRLADNTPTLQNTISPKMSEIPRKKRNSDYIPHDNDVLASILDGRRTPAVMIGPTPPLPKPPSLKRPRMTAKAGLPKRRKVLLDDTIVLHADAIRQQLINTEDIRRMRKKAPCTRPEIWRIQKSSLEDDIFCESIFTGVSEALHRLLTRTYDLSLNIHSHVNAHHSSGEASKGVELSRSSVFRDNDDQQMQQNVVLQKRWDDEMQVQSAVSESVGVESHKNTVPVDAQVQLESTVDLHHVNLPHTTVSVAELDILGHPGIVSVTHAASNSGIEEKHDDLCTDMDQNPPIKAFQTSQDFSEVNNNLLYVADGTSFEDFASADCAERAGVVSNDAVAAIDNDTSLEGKDFSNVKATTITVEDMGVDVVSVDNLDCPRDGLANRGNDNCGGASVSTQDRFMVEIGQDFPADPSTVIGCVNADVPGMVLVGGGPVTSDYQVMNESKAGKTTSVYETAVDEERSVSELPGGEKPQGVDVASVDNLDCPRDGLANRGNDNSGGASVSTQDRFMVEIGQDFPADPSTVIGCVNADVPGMVIVGGGPGTSDVMNGSEAGKTAAVYETFVDEERSVSELPGGEKPHIDSFPVPHTESELVPSAVGENSCLNREEGLDVERNTMECDATRESSDFCSAIDDIDTDFLNVDDDDDVDEYDEAANNDAPNAEEAQSLENSGWSSRTRGVAKYLKNMFDQESGRMRKSVAIDHLLAGKTRKEASRMFFETLVLKTKDYIHIEQENPFDSINIKPRIKLLKSEF